MKTRLIILMGVAGCGKTSVGKALANKLGWDFYDADDFHPPANIKKMANEIPLTDLDRIPWLDSLNAVISSCLEKDQPGVLACSALKERHRQALFSDNPAIQIFFLKGNYDLILSRMADRNNHYMKPTMLQSQFNTLEEPKNVFIVDISHSVEEIVEVIMTTINKSV